MSKIKLEMEVTPDQMIAIGQVLGGVVELPFAVIPGAVEVTIDKDVQAGDIITTDDVVTTEGTDTPPPPAAEEVPAPPKSAATAEESQSATPTGPATAASTVATSPGDVELDANGLPWDARIHGKAKKQNADKTWKYIKGIDRETLVPQVEAELRALLASAPPATSTAGSLFEQATPTGGDNDLATTTPPPPAETPASVSSTPTTFPVLLPLVTAAKANGTITDEQINKACLKLKLVDGEGNARFGNLAVKPELVAKFAEALGLGGA